MTGTDDGRDDLPLIGRRSLLRCGTLTAGGLAVGGTGVPTTRGRAGTTAAVAATGETVYVGSEDGTLYAFDAATGDQTWAFSDPADPVRSSPTVVGGTAYVGTGAGSSTEGSVYAVDAETGDQRWVLEEPSNELQASTTVVDGRVFAVAGDTADSASQNGTVYAIAADTGTVEWTFTDGTGFFQSAPNVVGDTLHVGGWDPNAENGVLYALDTETGAEQWRFTGTPDPILVSPTATADAVYVGSGSPLGTDGRLHAVDPADGTEAWSITAPEGPVVSPTVVDATVYAASWDGTLYAVDTEAQSVAWTFDAPDGIIASSPTVTDDGTVYVGDPTGTEAWTYAAPGDKVGSSPTVAGGVAYVGAHDGAVYAIDVQDGSEVWTATAPGDAVISSPTVVADPSSGDSVGSRVALGTLGHHGAWAGQGAETMPDITGFHSVHVDGTPYGHTGEDLPAEKTGEWADAHVESGTLVSAGAAPDLTVRVYRKVVGPHMYVGVYVPQEERDQTDALSPSQFDRFRVFVDRTGDDGLSDGDVGLVARPVRHSDEESPGSSDAIEAVRWRTYVVENGELVEFGGAPDPPLSNAVMVTDLADGGFGLEARIDVGGLDRTLDGESPDGEFRVDADVRSGDAHWGVDDDPSSGTHGYEVDGTVDAKDLPDDNSSIARVEVTQSVQDEDNSVTLVQNKDTAARVYVDNPESDPIEVDVEIAGFGRNDGDQRWVGLGTRTEPGFQAPPATHRGDEGDSVNFELPSDWTTYDHLLVRAFVWRRRFHDADTQARSETSGDVDFQDVGSWQSQVFVVRPTVNGDRATRDERNVNYDFFRRISPLPNVDSVVFVTPGNIGDLSPNADWELTTALQQHFWSSDSLSKGDNDFMHAVTARPGGQSFGTRVSWGDWRPFTMAHEVNHSLGGVNVATWSWHADWQGTTCGTDAPHDPTLRDYSNDNGFLSYEVGEVGWDPAHGVVRADNPELMSYCDGFSTERPDHWMSRYRWDRQLPAWTDQVTTSSTASSASTTQQSATARAIVGAIAADDSGNLASGQLEPSFEIPGTAQFPSPAVDDPVATIRVDYGDQVREIPLGETYEGESFAPVHGEAGKRPFGFRVPDDGNVVAVSLVDAATDEVLDAYQSTGYGLDDLGVATPALFDCGQTHQVDLTVESNQEDVTLHRQLFYRGRNGTWEPWGQSFTADTRDVEFTTQPGGTDARFMLLVSDGVETNRETSSPFEVPPLPPEVTIPRGQRWVYADPDGQAEAANVAGPIETTVGSAVSFVGDAALIWGRSIPAADTEWLVDGGEIQPDGPTVGNRFFHRFDSPGTYTVTFAGTDPDTGLSATDEVTVEVTRPPLPDAETVRAFFGYELPAYTNDENVVDTDGLRACVDDWREGEADSDVLRSAVDAWRSGQPVE